MGTISAFIDPGSNVSGVAVFVGKALLVARSFAIPDKTWVQPMKHLWMFSDIDLLLFNEEVEKIIVELPKIYKGSPVDPEDMIQLATLAGMFRADKYIRPQDWKRSVPKTKKLEDYIVKKRVEAVLSKEELDCIEGEQTSDTFDAIGMGLVCLGRLLPGLVKP